jgi:hypothetical protein
LLNLRRHFLVQGEELGEQILFLELKLEAMRTAMVGTAWTALGAVTRRNALHYLAATKARMVSAKKLR